ncbi:hypothetical protein DKT77_05440 [Meridianimarinicoccus roseus]|uniref:Uncharacterized protein n=1 Tax=Meridianimarinicoccus roseus TaxID=2072018 RepID=A0A2V2LKF6_9RHOB|nr:hypothetical protein [Meridianimarinicoccus roseus]PWR03587.1 hypothetical protein DKT77_05440 [Meridianimarinicoccus roseus]
MHRFRRLFRPRRPRRPVMPSTALSFALAAGLALSAVCPPGAVRAGTLTVIGDVNAGSADNLTLYGNVLGSGREVLFARGFAQLGGVVSHFRSVGATAQDWAGPLTGAVLAGVDLLVLTTSYNTSFDFTAPELAAVGAYGLAGGSVLLVAEGNAPAALDGYNAVLAGIGGYIRFTGQRFAQTETLTDLPETDLTSGMTGFRVSPYSTLSGGTSAVTASNGSVIAFEVFGAPPPAPVSLPPALPMLAGGIGVLLVLGCVRARAGGPGRPTKAIGDGAPII